MKYDRLEVFAPPVARWKTPYKRAVLWLYEHQFITRRLCQRLIDAAKARLA